MLTTKQAKATIVAHFPGFVYRKVYNEGRVNGGHIIKFFCSRNFDEHSSDWIYLRRALGSIGANSVSINYNDYGGRDILISVA